MIEIPLINWLQGPIQAGGDAEGALAPPKIVNYIIIVTKLCIVNKFPVPFPSNNKTPCFVVLAYLKFLFLYLINLNLLTVNPWA